MSEDKPRRIAENDLDFDYLEEPEGKARRKSSRWLKNTFAVLLSLCVLVGGGYLLYSKGSEMYRSMTKTADYTGNGVSDITITIPAGATAEKMSEILKEKDVVASQKAFLRAAERNPDAIRAIQAAQYKLRTQLPAAEVVKRLGNPANIVQNFVTVPEGLRNSLVVERIAKKTGIPASDLSGLLEAPKSLKLPDWSRQKSEGFLFPDTYSYDDSPTALKVLGAMSAQFVKVTNELKFVEKAKALKIDPYDAVTVASIIEREVHAGGDRAKVAQVIYNRLAKGMPLQMDSTVAYANNIQGKVTTTDEQRNSDSPYNTYKNPGLPPGAISNPGKLALEAAVNPSSGDLLYFVTVNLETGETKFATTFEQHSQNVAQFQQWCQANADRC